MKQPDYPPVSAPEQLDDEVRPDAGERAWVEGIRAGQVAAFEMLYRAYWRPLYGFAFRYVQSREEAEEVVQDVFFRIWRGRAEWRPTGAVRSYLYVAVRNAALDRLQHAAVAQRWRQRRVEALRAPAAVVPEIEAQLEAADLAAAVQRALDELPPKRRAVCALRWVDGLSYAQIADRLGITQKTVETQLGRGVKQLRDRVREARS